MKYSNKLIFCEGFYIILIIKQLQMKIVKSRFTKGVKASEINLKCGDKIKYQLLNGEIIDAIIESDKMISINHNAVGYKALTLDDNTRNFIDEKRIISWEGKEI